MIRLLYLMCFALSTLNTLYHFWLIGLIGVQSAQSILGPSIFRGPFPCGYVRLEVLLIQVPFPSVAPEKTKEPGVVMLSELELQTSEKDVKVVVCQVLLTYFSSLAVLRFSELNISMVLARLGFKVGDPKGGGSRPPPSPGA